MPEDIEDQLVKHLTDAHSIEEQALTQLRRAPQIAGDDQLEAIFAEHLVETERHEQRVAERLAAHDAKPSRVKDAAGKAGGIPMILFARSQADTPGKLTAHAFSYEHMEEAAYEVLSRVARHAGDAETVAMAEEIRDEERAMSLRLAGAFDAAAAASVRDLDRQGLDGRLDSYLADAHAIEEQAISLLQGGKRIAGADELTAVFEAHLAETRGHEKQVKERLEARGAGRSVVKDAAMRLGGLNLGAFFAVQPDTPAKLAAFAYAFEHLEIAGYELLGRVATRAGDADTFELSRGILEEEDAMAHRLAGLWDPAVDAALRAQGVAG